ncbi:HEAT repeat domain-containing protein [Nocardia nepalensis]|uniref:HEAT repeat domain-containing protein n=1 Tax=Nocardia nepalensis TaxID=3375448 RepID=UPI003B6741A2
MARVSLELSDLPGCSMINAVDQVLRAIADVDWAELEHAYGPAADAPAHLRALIDGDAEACVDAVGYLDAALLHQGSVYSATAPFVAIVAQLLSRPHTAMTIEDILPWDPEPRALRVALLDYLEVFAQGCCTGLSDAQLYAEAYPPGRTEEDLQRVKANRRAGLLELGPDPANALLVEHVPTPPGLLAAIDDNEFRAAMRARDEIACRAVIPDVIEAVESLVDDADAAVRIAALRALIELTAHPACAAKRTALLDRLDIIAPMMPDPAERATAARISGINGGRPEQLLTDDHPGVRTCAALAPAFATEQRAIDELLAALERPEVIDEWFNRQLPGQDGWLRHDVIRELVSRVDDFETLLPAAIEAAWAANEHTVRSDCISFLHRAFPDPIDAESELSAAQLSYLAVLAEIETLWQSGQLERWFSAAGLPGGRAGCRRLVEQ